MRWSWKIGEYRGIAVSIHFTFLFIIIWVAYSHWMHSRSIAVAIEGIIFVLAIFACVVLHEFGHALTAQKYGIKTRDITLYPIGGVARLERMPDEPRQELWVALAGPMVNVVIAAALFLLVTIAGIVFPIFGGHTATSKETPGIAMRAGMLAASVPIALFVLVWIGRGILWLLRVIVCSS